MAQGHELTRQTLVRPAGGSGDATATLNGLPTVPVTITATAFPNADTTGTAQATSSSVINVGSGTNTVSMTLGTTISAVSVTPSAPSVIVGQSTQLIATAQDAQGNIVLVAPSQWRWAVDKSDIATVSANGDHASLTGVSAGSVVVTVIDNESQLSGHVTGFVEARASGGQITGTVKDRSGALLSGASVTTSDGDITKTGTTDESGQYILNNVPAGNRVVTFARSGSVTSYMVTVAQGGTVTLNAVLDAFNGIISGPPVIRLNPLQLLQEKGQAIISGHIDQLDSNSAVLIINGQENLLLVSNGDFLGVAVLRSGLNSVQVRATNGIGTTLSERQQVNFTPTVDFNFRVTLNWNGRGDIDLHTFDSSGAHSSYDGKGIPTGELDVDNTVANGPENFTCTSANPGRYKFGVNYFAVHDGQPPVTAVLQVTINHGPNAGQTYFYGPYPFASANSNSGYPVTTDNQSWWRPVDIVVGNDGSISVAEADTSIPLGNNRTAGAPKKHK